MKPKLVIVTGNPLKFREISLKLSEFFDCEQKTLDGYFEIQGTSEEIIRHKLEEAYRRFQEPVLVDDTSLHFAALGGFPGPYIRYFFAAMKPWEMGEKFEGTGIKIVCHLGLCRAPGDILFGEGSVEGTVIKPATHDDKGTEFDLFAQLEGTDKPMIEFTPEEKNRFSHRGRALDDLLGKL